MLSSLDMTFLKTTIPPPGVLKLPLWTVGLLRPFFRSSTSSSRSFTTLRSHGRRQLLDALTGGSRRSQNPPKQTEVGTLSSASRPYFFHLCQKNSLICFLMLQWGWYCRCLWKFSNHSCGMKSTLASMASLLTTSISPSLLQTTPWKFSHSGREESVWNPSCFTSFRGISGVCWQPTPSQLEGNLKTTPLGHGMMVIWVASRPWVLK